MTNPTHSVTRTAIKEMRSHTSTGFGTTNLGGHTRQWVKRVIEYGESVFDGLTETLRTICKNAVDEIIDEMSVEDELPDNQDHVQQDFGPGRALFITSPDKTCMVYNTDIQTFQSKTLAESGAPNYLANCETQLMHAQKRNR